MNEKTLTVKEVASFLRVHTDMIYALVKKKEIPHMRLGNRILFTQESILGWIQDQEVQSLNRRNDSDELY